MYKSQLQEYAQKAGLPPPIYEVVKEGPSHEPRFKASVIFQGVKYETPVGFPSLKKAEQAAAQAALEALAKSSDGNGVIPGPVHESGLCKNLLQEYAQKCNLPLPVYRSERSGEIHSPTFSSTVEIAGTLYKGGTAKNKKEAEIKAAKTALLAIQSQTRAAALQATLTLQPQASHGELSHSNPSALPPEPRGGRKRGRNTESVPKGPTAKLKVEHQENLKELSSAASTEQDQQQSPLLEQGQKFSESQVKDEQLQAFPAQDSTLVGISVGSA